jgi:hypothetical protein
MAQPVTPGSDAFWTFQPFVDPGYFNPDFQFFAPAEVYDFGGEEKPNTGIYVTFDRMYVNVTRPIDTPTPGANHPIPPAVPPATTVAPFPGDPAQGFSFGSGNQGDFTWGNRMEIGYMKGDPSGWQAVIWRVNGPNENFSNADYVQRFTDNAGTLILNVPVPGAVDSVNDLKISNFELNKVFRLKPYHNGTTLEPIIGYRYMNVRDFFQRQSLLEFPGTSGLPVFAVGDEFLQQLTHRSIFENQLHGGQLGARLFRQRGHWMLSGQFTFFASANFQSLRVIDQQSIMANPDLELIDGTPEDKINWFGAGGLNGGGDINRQLHNYRATQFVFGGEVRGEASYELTRDINLRAGFVFMDLGQGIGRGDTLRFNNQAVQMAGVTFGLTVNR